MRSLILSAVVAMTASGLPPATAATARAGETPATIRVLLPADAALTIDGAPTQSTAAVRNFVTPPLPAGKDFRYDLRAQMVRDGKNVTIERRVTVRAGQETVTDLGVLGASAIANKAFYYSPGVAPAPVGPSVGIRSSIPRGLPADIGRARDNWKPDSSDPFYPWY